MALAGKDNLPENKSSEALAAFVAPIPIPSFAEFQAAMQQGLRVSSPHFVLHCSPRPAGQPNRIGALLPKRWAKKAVRRNMLRRKIYACAATWQNQLAQTASNSFDCVVRLRAQWQASAYPSASSRQLRQEVCVELTALFAQAQRKLQQRATPATSAAAQIQGALHG